MSDFVFIKFMILQLFSFFDTSLNNDFYKKNLLNFFMRNWGRNHMSIGNDFFKLEEKTKRKT